jgi:lysophospholipase L1-like esterase
MVRRSLLIFVIGVVAGGLLYRVAQHAYRSYRAVPPAPWTAGSDWTGGLDNQIKLANLSFHKERGVLLLGDSLTAYGPWSGLSSCPYVINKGLPGWTTSGIAALAPAWLHPRPPNGVFIQGGINDLLYGLSEDGITSAIRKVAQLYSDAGARVFVTSLFPVARGYGPPDLNDRIVSVNRSLASTPNTAVLFVNVHASLADQQGYLRERFTTDGLHLSADGYEVWRDAIPNHIRENCQTKP